MRTKNLGERERLLEICFDCFCRNGLEGTSTKMLAEACGMIESTAHCMAKVEDDFMANAPQNVADIRRFLKEIPYWTAEKHGAKYRFMYQVYTSPKYRQYGTDFFKGVTKRYTEYAKLLERKLGIPCQVIRPLIYILVRACVHYALFEDEEYLQPQLALIEEVLPMIAENIRQNSQAGNRLSSKCRRLNEYILGGYSMATRTTIRKITLWLFAAFFMLCATLRLRSDSGYL